MPGRALTWLLAATGLPGGLLLGQSQPESDSGAPMFVVPLEARESERPLLNIGMNLEPGPVSFVGEPEVGRDKVRRQVLKLGVAPGEGLPFLWNVSKGTLYLDLNRNRDLRDDPQGAYTNAGKGYYQEFQRVRLPVADTNGVRNHVVDLSCANQGGSMYGFIALRSYWHARFELDGKEHQLGLIEGWQPHTRAHSLLLRPWAERDRPFDVQGSSRVAFDFPSHVFFAGHAFRVAARSEPDASGPRFHLNLTVESPTLGELRLTGQHLHRVVLTGEEYTLVLDDPPATVRAPLDIYHQATGLLRDGSIEVSADRMLPGRGLSSGLQLTATNAATLTLGGPLTNVVTVRRRAGTLVLGYELAGAGGATYRRVAEDRTQPPRFRVLQGDRELASGKFEYG